MFDINCRILSLLFLGHLIAGVNRDVPHLSAAISSSQEAPNTAASIPSPYLRNSASVILSAVKMLNSASAVSSAEEITSRRKVEHNDMFPTSTWQTQSVITSQTSVCPPHDSCSGRCGEMPKSLPYTCNCDSMCIKFSDCCADYNIHCGVDDGIANHTLTMPQMTCEIFFTQYNLLTVGDCPIGYNDTRKEKMCSTKIPKYCIFPENLNVSDARPIIEKCKESVIRNCMTQLSKTCDSSIEPMCKVVSKNCDKLANEWCKKCNDYLWPVFGKDGLIYRNSFCAQCNSQSIHVILSPYILKNQLIEIGDFNLTDKYSTSLSRHCVPVDVDSCPEGAEDNVMRELCHNHTGAVIASTKRRKVYKNAHCALCNGEEWQSLQCAKRSSLVGRILLPLINNVLTTVDSPGMQFDHIPAAFSILLNFGPYGQERMHFFSESEKELKRQQELCGSENIWDPFSKVCRKLYCSTEFVLVDYKCVRKESLDNGNDLVNDTSFVVPDARTEFVNLTLSVEMEILDFLQFYGQEISEISETFRKSLANAFLISIDRVRDVRFNVSIGDYKGLNEFLEEIDDFSPIKFTLEFKLYEDYAVNITAAEPSVDSIVSLLASSLSMDGFKISINNVTSRIFEIHQAVTPLTSWCRPEDGGEKKEYWNSEFTLTLYDFNVTTRDNQVKGIYVNKTGKFYPQGMYVANILFQGYQFGGNLINVSGVAIVCDRKKKLDESCMRIQLDSQEYSFLENESLFIHNESLRNMIDTSNYEFADNNSLLVCISLKSTGKNSVVNIKIDVVQAMVSYVLLCLSVVALLLVLITYTVFGSLRNLPGCNTMNLTFSLFAMQLTFIFGQRNTVTGTACILVAYLLHYEILCCFMWMNVMAFDLFRTFGNENILSSIRSKRRFLPRYMAYAYLSPFGVLIVTSLLDYFARESSFAPNYGRNNVCWIFNQHSAIVFFATPLAVIMCVNFILFLLTVLAMKSVKSLSNMADHQTNKNGKSDLFLYARMAIVIGLTWALSFSAASVRQSAIEGQILTYLFIFFNTLQGVFIFWVFVCNKKVFQLYKGAFRGLVRQLSMRAKREGSSATLSGYSDAVKRTISTNTVVSTISNASEKSCDSRIPLDKK